jgi:hypothetical protein
MTKPRKKYTRKVFHKRNVILEISGKRIPAKFFVTEDAANNYIKRHPETSIVFWLPDKYYVGNPSDWKWEGENV